MHAACIGYDIVNIIYRCYCICIAGAAATAAWRSRVFAFMIGDLGIGCDWDTHNWLVSQDAFQDVHDLCMNANMLQPPHGAVQMARSMSWSCQAM